MDEPNNKTRVIKIGGSLLNQRTLPERINKFLIDSPRFRHVIVVGGGGLANCVRDWHATHGLTEDYCHWASVRLMSETTRLLGELCPQIPVVPGIEQIPIHSDCILDCRAFLEDHSRLGKTWATTSDSIAAEIARSIHASELWLFKSILPTSSSMKQWQVDGIVDDQFPGIQDWPGSVYVANANTPELLSIRGR